MLHSFNSFFLEFHQKTTLVKNLECPECQHPVPVTCLGGHETSDWPCAIAKSAPCGRKCGRSLACENHTCDRDCHKVKNAPNDLQSGSNCRQDLLTLFITYLNHPFELVLGSVQLVNIHFKPAYNSLGRARFAGLPRRWRVFCFAKHTCV